MRKSAGMIVIAAALAVVSCQQNTGFGPVTVTRNTAGSRPPATLNLERGTDPQPVR